MTNKYQPFTELIRPYNAMTPVLAFCIGYFFSQSEKIQWYSFWLGILSIFLIHSIATIRNDINDYEIDAVNSPHKPLPSQRIKLKTAKSFSIVLALILLCIAVVGFPIQTIFIALMILLAILYNERPFFLSRKPVSSLIVLALMYSTMPFLYGYLLTHAQIEIGVIYTLLAWFLLRLSISVLKDFKDAEGDAMFNKKTFYLSFGKKATVIFSLAMGTLGVAGILYTAMTIQESWWLIIALLLGLYGLYLRYSLLKADGRQSLTSIFHKIFFGENQFDLVYLLWVLLK